MNNRIIVKPSLFSNERFIDLTKQETDMLFKIVTLFADNYEDKLHYEIIEKEFGEIDYEVYSTILKTEEEFILIGDYFKYFKTKVYTAKSRLKKKSVMLKELVEEHVENLNMLIKTEDEVEEEIKEEKVETKKEYFDYEKFKEIWNDEFKDTVVPKIAFISDNRKKTIKSLFYKVTKLINVKDIKPEVFYATYFNKFSQLKIAK